MAYADKAYTFQKNDVHLKQHLFMKFGIDT